MAPPIRFGITWGMHPDRPSPPEAMFSTAEAVEALGFDSLWIGDHIAFHGGHFTESLTTLAAFAARTTRLTIGTSVYLLPLRTPGVAAKTAATVDFLSGGDRFVFGVGVGGEGKEEFDLCGVSLKERGARTDEAIEIIRKLWSGKPICHEGRFWSFEETIQSPPPATPGGPPIWCGGRSDRALERMGRLADGWVSYVVTPEQYAEGLSKIAAAAEAAGREIERFDTAHLLFARVADDYETAFESANAHLSQRYAMDFSRATQRYAAIVEDGIVTKLAVEEPMKFEVSSAEAILEAL